jgi:CheY-like chemotaxis protein
MRGVLHLPAAKGPAPAPSLAGRQPDQTQIRTGSDSPLRILVVEDESMIALALCEILEQMGHEICGTASTEAGAVGAAHHTNPDLIIIDGRLREGSGIAAMRKILTARYVPHIYVSGDSLAAEDLSPFAITMRKPFSDSELTEAIARATDPNTHTASGNDPHLGAR